MLLVLLLVIKSATGHSIGMIQHGLENYALADYQIMLKRETNSCIVKVTYGNWVAASG